MGLAKTEWATTEFKLRFLVTRNRPEWDLEGQAEARTNSLSSKREATENEQGEQERADGVERTPSSSCDSLWLTPWNLGSRVCSAVHITSPPGPHEGEVSLTLCPGPDQCSVPRGWSFWLRPSHIYHHSHLLALVLLETGGIGEGSFPGPCRDQKVKVEASRPAQGGQREAWSVLTPKSQY